VQRACDSRTGQRFRFTELGTERHEARHFLFGKSQLMTPSYGEFEVGDAEWEGGNSGHATILAG
jgi:hypothetical protein